MHHAPWDYSARAIPPDDQSWRRSGSFAGRHGAISARIGRQPIARGRDRLARLRAAEAEHHFLSNSFTEMAMISASVPISAGGVRLFKNSRLVRSLAKATW